jgi:F-type H+-transporting ATPase subunit delta
MKGTRVASRYAKSLFLQAKSEGLLEKIKVDAELLLQYCRERSFRSFLISPVIKAVKKEEIFTNLFNGVVAAQTLDFLKFLAHHRRENLLPEICQAFLRVYNTDKGITEVSLVTAISMNDEMEKQVAKLLSGIVKGEVKMEQTDNPAIIGGFILKIGDRMIDASVSSQLAQARINLSKNVYSTQTN